ncbi:transcriptional repressor DicA [Legionella pneumophila]|nr:transcriptional repressor DicA [Legionella pneumophila]ETO94108.1 putative transcriptional regulator [Legionella oakridgensis RV-2-2007]KTD07288.1 phage repressor [Legionella jamestowniensis]KTD62854.1 phage repressor [Legionella santicrucis]QLZ68057.1 XRE family transcriptional regulator [Legionella sp. PC1000]SFL95141.1 Helix-turn-helix domain-containing protein [Legionella jamestowniensis DSM 19215]
MKKIIGSRIAQARRANGLTIKVLADRTGFGAARIGNWEQGTRSPGPEEAKSLSKELQVAASWLLCLTDDPLGERVEKSIIANTKYE